MVHRTSIRPRTLSTRDRGKNPARRLHISARLGGRGPLLYRRHMPRLCQPRRLCPCCQQNPWIRRARRFPPRHRRHQQCLKLSTRSKRRQKNSAEMQAAPDTYVSEILAHSTSVKRFPMKGHGRQCEVLKCAFNEYPSHRHTTFIPSSTLRVGLHRIHVDEGD